MGLLDGLFGRKRDEKFDWLELRSASWADVATDANGIEYSIDNLACFISGNTVWWKQRAGTPLNYFQYSICAGNIEDGRIIVVIARTLSDPDLKVITDDELQRSLRPGAVPLIDECLKRAKARAWFTDYKTPPPIYLYGSQLI